MRYTNDNNKWSEINYLISNQDYKKYAIDYEYWDFKVNFIYGFFTESL
jgi:hypothetical protein